MVQGQSKRHGYGSAFDSDEESFLVGEPRELEEKTAFPSLRVLLLCATLSLLGCVAVAYESGTGTPLFSVAGGMRETMTPASLKETLVGSNVNETSADVTMTLNEDFHVAFSTGEVLESNCDCEKPLARPIDCQPTTNTGWKGLDLVDLYNNHLAGMTYDIYTPKSGSTLYTTNYGGYTLQFLSEENRIAFEENPTKYTPQYGGFCAYGIAVEYCNFNFLWDKDCLGPESSADAWQYIDEKLYFYRAETAMTNFNAPYQTEMLSSANARWASWYDEGDIVVNSACMLDDVGDSTWSRA